ncbi:MAG: hypothetical protein QNL33_20010 [Akkermansiaceae bacterium]
MTRSLLLPLAFVISPLQAGDSTETPGTGSDSVFLAPNFFTGGASRLDLEADSLTSDDVEILKSSLRFEQTRGSWKVAAAVGEMRHAIDYEPFTTTLPSRRVEVSHDYRLELQKTISPNWTMLATGAYVDGFSDHRSIWISEFYDQSNSRNPAYREADPGSVAFSLGGQWSYRPGLGSVLVTVGYSRAEIVPGWGREFNPSSGRFELVSTDSELETYSGGIVWKTAVNPRLVSKHTLRFTETEDRELRTQIQTEWAFALTDDLTVRAQLGGAEEKPDFDALYGGVTLVYEFNEQWQMDLGYRYYQDSGEINSSNFNTAAPGIESRELSLGFLWSNGATSIRASVGFYETDFDPIDNPVNDVFTNLYQDRDFISARFAITHQF